MKPSLSNWKQTFEQFYWAGGIQGLILLLVIITISPAVVAQTKVWDKTFGGTDSDGLASAQLTSDGGFILGGTSYSGMGGDKTEPNKGSYEADFWIIKLK